MSLSPSPLPSLVSPPPSLFLSQSVASTTHINGVASNERDEESYEDDEDEEEEEEEDEEEEGLDTRGSSRPLSESDLHALEMLEPGSSSHDDSIDSSDQLDAAVSLSVLSVGISAVRERSNRALQQRHHAVGMPTIASSSSSSATSSSTTGSGGGSSILVIMSPSSSMSAQPPPPPPRSSVSSSSLQQGQGTRGATVRLSSSSGRLLSGGDLIPVHSSTVGRQGEEEEEEEEEGQSGTDPVVEISFDLDSSTESAGSRVEPVGGGGGGGEGVDQTQEVTSSTVSVIMTASGGAAGARTSDGSNRGGHDEVVSSSSNGSASVVTPAGTRREDTESNNDRTTGRHIKCL